MSNKIPIPADGNAQGIRRALAMLVEKLSELSNQIFATLTLSGLTASRLTASDANKKLVPVDLADYITEGESIDVADDGDGTVTIKVTNIDGGTSTL